MEDETFAAYFWGDSPLDWMTRDELIKGFQECIDKLAEERSRSAEHIVRHSDDLMAIQRFRLR